MASGPAPARSATPRRAALVGWWPVLATAAAALVLVAADAESRTAGLVAAVLAASAVLHGARRAALPGAAAQTLGRVVVAAAGVLGVAWILGAGTILGVFAGLEGAVVAALVVAAALAAAGAVGVSAWWAWSALGRARRPGVRTARALTLVPALPPAVASVVLAAGDRPPERPAPSGRPQTVGELRCPPGPRSGCAAAAGPVAAGGGARTVVAWRDGAAVHGVVVPDAGATVPLRLPNGARSTPGEDPPPAVAAAPGGGHVLAWGDRGRVRIARVGADGAVGRGRTVAVPGTDAVLAVAGGDRGAVLVATVRATTTGGRGVRRHLRALPLGTDLRPRGAWRTVRDEGVGTLSGAAVLPGGRTAVTLGGSIVRTTLTLDARARAVVALDRGTLLAPGAGGDVRPVAVPSPGRLTSSRGRPELVGAVRAADGAVRSLWSTRPTRRPGDPSGLRDLHVDGAVGAVGAAGAGRPLARGLEAPVPVTTSAGVAVVGLRRSDGPRAEIALVRAPRPGRR